MLHLGTLKLDPMTEDPQRIEAALTQHAHSSQPEVWVTWTDFSLTQARCLEIYLPWVKKAQALGCPVYCKMPQAMAQHLVRIPHLMFVDPLFLYKFHFKQIEFVIPFKNPHATKKALGPEL